MENDITARVGKLEDDMSDLKILIRGYWEGTKRVPGILDVLQQNTSQNTAILSELQKRDEAHEQLVKAAWGLVRPVIAGIISIVVLQLIVLISRTGFPGVHIP